MISSSVIVSLKRASKRHVRGDISVQALRKVSVDVASGDFLAIAGPSGSGKSSLLNVLGLLDRPDDGALRIDGNEVDFSKPADLERLRREKLGFVFQNFNLIPVLTALENVELPLFMSNMSSKARRDRARDLLHAVGLGGRTHHTPRQLSGGQQQRVAVARALVTEPLVVLADEPTANLDSETTYQLLDLMGELNERCKTAFVFSTHDSRVIDKAKRVLHLRDGEVVE